MTTATTVKAPKWPMLTTCAAGLVALGAAVAGVLGVLPWPAAVVGYVFGCVIAVATASVHRALENKEKSNPQFRFEPYLGAVTRIAMIAGIVGGLLCAYFLATEVAKW